jgi:hypothetical protein
MRGPHTHSPVQKTPITCVKKSFVTAIGASYAVPLMKLALRDSITLPLMMRKALAATSLMRVMTQSQTVMMNLDQMPHL